MSQDYTDLIQCCTVKITTRNSKGTGFAVAPGIVVTCRHVVQHAGQKGATVIWPHHSLTSSASVQMAPDANIDLALIYLNHVPQNHLCVCLEQSENTYFQDMRVGEPLYCYGFQQDFAEDGAPSLSIYEGHTRGKHPLIKFKDASIQPGISGAALLNLRTAHVCGVVKETLSPNYPKGGCAVTASHIFHQFPELVVKQQQFKQQHPKLWLPSSNKEVSRKKLIGIPNNLPYKGKNKFIGRDNLINTLDANFKYSEQINIIAINGMGGIGKTEIALQYARQKLNGEEFSGGVCWLQARDQNIATQIITFAQANLDLDISERLHISAQIDYCWQHWPEGQVLLILDDVTDFKAIEAYLPPSNSRFKVLITTRIVLGSSIETIPVEVLDDENAINLLETIVGETRVRSQLGDTKSICHWVDNLPLGLELIGRFLVRKPDYLLSDLLQQLNQKRIDAKALIKTEFGMTAKLGIAATLELSWRELNNLEKKLGCLLSLFSTTPIPWNLIENCFPSTNPRKLEDARDEGLIANSLLKRVGSRQYQLHKVVQEFFRAKLIPQYEKNIILENLFSFSRRNTKLIEEFSSEIVSLSKDISIAKNYTEVVQYKKIIPHVHEAINLWSLIAEKNTNIYWLLCALGCFYKYIGDYYRAESAWEDCLDISKKFFGNQDPLTVHSSNMLAGVFKIQGRYQEAEDLYQKVLDIYTINFGKEHISIAHIFLNLAQLYTNAGRYPEAQEIYFDILASFSLLLEKDDDFAFIFYNDLGLLYSSQGQYDEAQESYLEAFKRKKNIADIDILKSIIHETNLASNYISKGNFKDADFLLEQVCTKVDSSGVTHPYLATVFNCLAESLNHQCQYSEAEKFYIRAIDILVNTHENTLTVDIAQIQTNLGNLYEKRGEYTKAEDQLLEALNYYESVFTSGHHKLAQCLTNLGLLYGNQGRVDKAQTYYSEALEIYTSIQGFDNREFATYLHNSALLLHQQGRYPEAEAGYLESLDTYQKLLKSDHPSIANTLNSLAANYCNQQKYGESEKYNLLAIEMFVRIFGDQHADVAQSKMNIATLYLKLGDYKKSEILYQESIETYQKISLEDHVDMARSHWRLGTLYKLQRQEQEAKYHFTKAYEIISKKKDVSRLTWEISIGAF